MKITFIVEAKTYLEAAEVEECLRNKGIKYVEKVGEQRKPSPRTGVKRPPLTWKVVRSVRRALAKDPELSDAALKQKHLLTTSPATIGRIRLGKLDKRFPK